MINREKQIGHFTQMVTDDAFAVGCAATRYYDGSMISTLLACDYSRTNVIDGKVYVAGKSASECKSGKNPEYLALCSEREKYQAWYYV